MTRLSYSVMQYSKFSASFQLFSITAQAFQFSSHFPPNEKKSKVRNNEILLEGGKKG